VWRCYRGGLLLERLLGEAAPADGDRPEAWLASTTRAINGPHSQGPDEGLSRVRGERCEPGPLLADVLPGGAHPGVLCKLLDTAMRLPIQCHPDRAMARAHFDSEHGKSEVWLVLGTREIDGRAPHLLLGFGSGATREDFGEAVQRQDVAAMQAMLHRVPVAAGDAFLVPGRLPHAIGPGVLMLEVQEPTDWVVQPERMVGEVELADSDMWGPLAPEVALDVFDFEARGGVEAVLGRTRLRWEEARREEGGAVERLVGSWGEVRFTIERVTVLRTLELPPAIGNRMAVVLQARGGVLEHRGRALELRPGDSLVLPDGVGPLRLRAREAPLVVVLAAAV